MESGQILAIIGASGAGKTSLLDVLVGNVGASCLLLLFFQYDVCSARGNLFVGKISNKNCLEANNVEGYMRSRFATINTDVEYVCRADLEMRRLRAPVFFFSHTSVIRC